MMLQPRMRRSIMSICFFGLASMASVANAATFLVDVANFQFTPANVEVAPGDTVQWDWTDAGHSVTSGTSCTPDARYDSGVVVAGSTFSYVIPLDEPDGVIDYFCIPHCLIPMVATITVVGPGPPIPTMSQWGIVVMLLLLLAAGTVTFAWKRRATHAG